MAFLLPFLLMDLFVLVEARVLRWEGELLTALSPNFLLEALEGKTLILLMEVCLIQEGAVVVGMILEEVVVEGQVQCLAMGVEVEIKDSEVVAIGLMLEEAVVLVVETGVETKASVVVVVGEGRDLMQVMDEEEGIVGNPEVIWIISHSTDRIFVIYHHFKRISMWSILPCRQCQIRKSWFIEGAVKLQLRVMMFQSLLDPFTRLIFQVQLLTSIHLVILISQPHFALESFDTSLLYRHK